MTSRRAVDDGGTPITPGKLRDEPLTLPVLVEGKYRMGSSTSGLPCQLDTPTLSPAGLSELFAKLAAAPQGSISLDIDVLKAVWPNWRREEDHSLYFVTSSLDAAMALVERVLAARSWDLHHTMGAERVYTANLLPPASEFSAQAHTAPLALLAALLKALHSKAGASQS